MTEFGKHAKIWPNFKYHKSILGCVAPLSQPRSVYKSDWKKSIQSDVECHFLECCDKMAKRPWRSRLMTAIFNISYDAYLGENFVILAQIHYKLCRQTKFPRILSWNDWNDLHNDLQGQLPLFSTPTESIPWGMFGANLVIPAPFCDELLCRQEVHGWTDGQTDGQMQATTIPNQPERSWVKILLKNEIYIVLKMRKSTMPKTCENWLGLVNSGIYLPAKPVKFTKYCFTQWISKLSEWVSEWVSLSAFFR